MKTLAVINQKGGVGKSTTAAAIAGGFTLKGYKVLMVDLDGQQSLTTIVGAESEGYTVLDALTRRCTAADAVKHTESGDILTAADGLGAADTLLKDTGREYRLKEVLQPIKKKYDLCIIDCPPSLGILAINALTAADTCIVPAQADYLSLQAIGQLQSTISTVRTYTNRDLDIAGIVITRYSGRAVLSRDAVEMLQAKACELDTRVFGAKIRECIAIKEAQAVQQSIYKYAVRSNGVKDYSELVEEITREVMD